MNVQHKGGETLTPILEAVEADLMLSQDLENDNCGSRDGQAAPASAALAKGKSLGEKLFDANCSFTGLAAQFTWQGLPDHVKTDHERAALAFAARLTHDETDSAVIAAQAEEIGYLNMGRMLDAETIGELMEDGAVTWRPICEAKPERNGSLIIMTGDASPIVGQAFWHEHGEGDWHLHWSAISPAMDCWNDPIDETNHGVIAFRPLPDATCDARVKALAKGDSRDVTYIGLTARALAAEAQVSDLTEEVVELRSSVKLAIDLVERDVIRVRPTEREELMAALTTWHVALTPNQGDDHAPA